MAATEAQIREFVAASEADSAMGMKIDASVELRRSQAVKALVESTPCPKCGSTTIQCGKGRKGVTILLWQMRENVHIHSARHAIINRAVRALFPRESFR